MIVITDKRVAGVYKNLLRSIGVEVSDLKSLVSEEGAAEFAKRYFVRCLSKDLSPVSMKNLLGSHHFQGLLALSRLVPNLNRKILFKIHGCGYRTLGRLCCNNPPKRLQRLIIMADLYRLPLRLWLARGGAISPYTLASLVSYGFKKLKPKDVRWPPSEMIGEKLGARYASCLEITLIRSNLIKQLSYLKWYWQLWSSAYIEGTDPISIIIEMLDAPIVITDWKLTKSDPELIRFGLVFQLFDLAGEIGLDFVQLCLPNKVPFNWVYLGDHTGIIILNPGDHQYWGSIPKTINKLNGLWEDREYSYHP